MHMFITNMHSINEPVYRRKMAAFDYDWTMVNPKEGKTFPLDVDDWEWYHPSVPVTIKQYYDDDYMIVIFTNQTKKWKCDQLMTVAKSLGIPMFVVIAMNKCDHKPNISLFDKFMGEHTIDKDESFFVGDALGRRVDFSDSDKVFAQNIGVRWYSPETCFKLHNITFETPIIEPITEPEIIIMMGYPGSGKTTIASEICTNLKYVHIKGDDFKTSSKMIKASMIHIKDKSIVFDATNSSVKKRKEYIDHARKYNYKVRCIYLSTPLDISFKRNRLREDSKQIPKIAYSIYKKYFEEPCETEGFELIRV